MMNMKLLAVVTPLSIYQKAYLIRIAATMCMLIQSIRYTKQNKKDIHPQIARSTVMVKDGML